ncbi:MAG: hypothetical protein IKF05_09420 [Erysipelotrichaceae bacterium]|nr:hypothetical protein [Erysipelotrichaceae bacterium]
MNQRKLAYDVLKKVILQKQYANLLMQKALNSLPADRRPFVTELVNGVLRNYALLKYQFTGKTKSSTKESDLLLLSMAAYERFFMNEKDYAVTNEYVKLAENDRGFINAMLRGMKELKVPEGDDPKDLAIRYSLPEWLVRMWKSQYTEDLLYLLEDAGKRSPVAYRLNPRKANREDLLFADAEFFDEYGFYSSQNLIDSEAFRKGAFYVQDRNAQQAVKALNLEKDSVFLDACSAPGGKLFNALETVAEASCYGNELHPSKAEELIKRLALLGYSVRITSLDARKLNEVYDFEFDRIMLDAPCSGLGVLKRKPDLRYNVRPEDLDDLQKTQSEILDTLSGMLKKEGILVYSTCTLNKKENEKQIVSFLKRHPEFLLESEHTFLHEEGDHFYLAKLRKTI